MAVADLLKNKLNLLLIPLILIGATIPFARRYIEVKNRPADQEFVQSEVDFKYLPPSQSLAGVVTDATGDVKKNSREENIDEPVVVANLSEILNGEDITTGTNSEAKIEFGSSVNILLNEETTVSMVDLIPTDLTFNQTKGNVIYNATGKYSMSVRTLRTLVSIESSVVLISTNPNTEITVIEVQDGKAKAAIVDADNNTLVIEIEKGKIATINNKDKTYTIK